MPVLHSAGLPILGRSGRPLLNSPDNKQPDLPTAPKPPNGLPEPDAPTGWGEVFWDAFPGTTLDRAKWQVLFGGSSSGNGALVWDHAGVVVNNGLTLRTWNPGTGWRGGGLMQGNIDTGFAGYGDCQISLKARFPAGRGVGAIAAASLRNNQPPPNFEFITTPGRVKNELRANLTWSGNAAGTSVTYPVDLTVDHVYTVRRTAGRWNYWVDGIEQTVPPEWAANGGTLAVAVALMSFVAAAADAFYGGVPDSTSPNPYEARIAWVRVVAPGGGALTPIPGDTASNPDPEPPPPVATTGPAAFIRDTTMGLNVERREVHNLGWMTLAQYQEYKAQGVTHVRFFTPNGSFQNIWPTVTNGDMDWWLNSLERAMAAGLKIFGSLLDIMQQSQMNDSRVMPYLRAMAERIRDRNWDTTKCCIGAVNEYAAGTNVGFEPKRTEAFNLLRSILPNHLLLIASADWGGPSTMMNGSLVLPNDPNMILEWHLYSTATNLSTTQYWQNQIAPWAAARNLTVICGEWGQEPPAGPPSNTDYALHVKNAAEGMGQQRPMMWVVTNGSYWRLNKSGTASLLDSVATAFRNGDAHIRAQQWWKDANAVTAPPPAEGPPSITINNSPGRITEASPGAGVYWDANLSVIGIPTAEYQVRDAAGVAYTGWLSLPISTDPQTQRIFFRKSGDRLAIQDPNDSTVQALSDAVIFERITITNEPGTLTETTAGGGANWSANLSIIGLPTVEYQVRDSAGVAYTAWLSLTVTADPMSHSVLMRKTGDRLFVRKPGTDSLLVQSSAVTLTNTSAAVINSVTTSSSLTVAAGTLVNHVISTSGLKSVGWVVSGGADVNYAWQTTEAYVDTTGQVTVAAPIRASGQFVKAIPPVGINIAQKDGPAFTVTGTTEPTPTGTADPPSGWTMKFEDNFTRAPTFGVEALDPNKWLQRAYGAGVQAHNRSDTTWSGGAGIESTGSTLRVHTRRKSGGGWAVDGFQQGVTDRPGQWGYHPGYGQFHVRFMARYTPHAAKGVGGYCLMWPASNKWASEIDFLEMPGATKSTADATIHWDRTGEYKELWLNNDRDHATSYSSASVNLSNWHVWDCRRTYRTINGDVRATLRIWIDGVEMNQPSGWVDNSFIDEQMVFGAASYVAPDFAGGWYTLPDSSTPNDSWLELEYVRIWTP